MNLLCMEGSSFDSSVVREVCASDGSPVNAPESATPNPAWNDFRGLVWPNFKASDSVWIRAALLRPQFGVLLRIAREFGLERLWEEWRVLEAEVGDSQVERARAAAERILTNVEIGFQRRVVA